ncbi:autotransporter outer membrane beta-barrel domain-containing protein [Mesorhizobium denitrificans]|uniref:Autotransporter outer membrane beta-barrel domain-containing protein n=1 Tax=Mesorhizobium denitrificans TaxID=2294114 RepID=A0A371X237_9HYPH|nr:autotransporter outer membrane beta-barrel domain-containing protein [Mesorhizobium denitrificans]
MTGGSTSIANLGTIGGGMGDGGVALGIYNLATITSLNNLNTITGGIRNEGTITALTNRQAGLVYTGAAPTIYSMVIAGSGTGEYGQLSVKDSAGWGVSNLNFGIATDSAVAAGVNYNDVIRATGSTTFDSTTAKSIQYRVDGDFYNYSLDYDGTNWDLLFVSMINFESATTALHNSPAGAAAVVLDANPEVSSLFGALDSEVAYSSAATQSLPLLVGGSQAAASVILRGTDRVIRAHQDRNRSLSSGDVSFGDPEFWAKPFGSWADQDDRKGVSGYSARTGGLAVGADAAFSDTARAGIAFVYSNADVTGNSSVAPNSANVDAYQLIGYGNVALDPVSQLSYQLGLGMLRNDGLRGIPLADLSAQSAYDSLAATAAVNLSRAYKSSEQTTFTPSIGAEYTWIKDEAYTETGADALNLAVDGRNADSLVLAIEGEVAHEITPNTALKANVGVGYDVLQDQSSITSAFAGAPGAIFTTEGLDQNPWLVRGGFGLESEVRTGMEVSARYDVEYREDFLNQTASVNLRLAF